MKFLAEYKIQMKNSTILRICGNESEILVQSSSNLPIIQGSSIGGAFREFASNFASNNEIDTLFGTGSQNGLVRSSHLIISDAIGDKFIKEERTQISIDAKSGTARDGHLVKQNYLSSGSVFEFKIKIYADNQENLNNDVLLIKKCLEAIHHEYIKFGSKKTSGAGSFKINKVQIYFANLSKTSDLMNYIKNNKIYNEVMDFNHEKFNYKLINQDLISIKFETVSPLLIGSDNAYNPNEPDKTHIKDSDNNLIIPGSSLKGVIRNQCEKLENYFGLEGICSQIFGNSESSAGRLMFSDYKLNPYGNNIIYNRIKIDYFTAGVMDGELVEELPTTGTFNFRCLWNRLDDNLQNNQAIGIILLVLKDLADGSLSIGSGYSIGRGRLKSDAIYLNNIKVIDFKQKINQEALKYIESLKINKLEVL